MPSTRSRNEPLEGPLDNDYSDETDDEYDPDYREDSESDTADDLPKNMQRDRAKWITTNVEEIEWLYRKLLEDGRSVFGNALLQTGTINNFANYLYRHTMPFSETS